MSKSSNVRSIFLPPPIKGIRLGDPLVSGVPEYALGLQNLISKPEGLIGLPQATLGTAVGTSLFTVLPYRNTSVFVTGSTKIMALGSSVSVYAITNGTGWPCEISTASGSYLFFFNGVDVPGIYNGAAWAAASFTGPTLTNLFQGLVYRSRLYMADKTKQGFWYLAPGSITGAATFYDAGSLFSKGGSVVAMSTLSVDGGTGPDDRLVIWTAGGQVAVFSGNDPGQSTWQVVGVYNVGIPACGSNFQPKVMAKLGGDVLCFTARGIFSLVEIASGKDASLATSISENIDPRIFYWITTVGVPSQSFYITILPSEHLLVVNLPFPEDLQVMDLRTKAWSSLNASVYQGAINPVEFFDGTRIVIYAGGNFAIATLFNYNTSPQGMMNGTWSIVTPYTRFGQMSKFKVLNVFPWLYYGFAAAPSQANTIESNIGIAYNLSGEYNNPRSKTALNSNATDWQSQWASAGRFYKLYDDDGTLGTNQGRVLKSDISLVNPEYNRAVSLNITGNLLTASSPAQVDLFRYSGCDVSFETELTTFS